MEPKFKKGDICKIRTSNETVMVLEYKVNHGGGIVNMLTHRKDYPDSVVTDQVLCEGIIAGKFQKKYITEANLELTPAP